MKPLACKQELETDHAQLYDILVSGLSEFVVFLMDADGCIVSWHPGVKRIFDYEESEWVGQSVEMIFTPEDRGSGLFQQELSAALATGQSTAVRCLVRQDGRRVFVKGTTVALRGRSGQHLGFSKVMLDVSEREGREWQLRDALLYSESVVNTVNQPLLILDQELRIRSANRAFYRAYSLSRRETEGALLYALRNGEWDLAGLRSRLISLVAGGKCIENFELEHAFGDRGQRVLLLNARSLLRDSEQQELFLLSIEDISDRKRTEVALAESEKQRRLLLDSVPALIGYIDADLRFRVANGAYERWFGCKPNDLIGQPISTVFDAAFLRTVQPRIEAALRGETVAFEEDYPSLGDSRTLQVTYTPDLDAAGKVQGFMVLGSDITGRKRSEIALRRSEERWRTLFGSMSEGFFVGEILYDKAGKAFDFRFREVNPAFQTWTDLEDVTGKTMREVIPEIGQDLIERYARIVETGEAEQFELFVPALQQRWYEVRAKPTVPPCFAVLFLEITERKKSHAQVLESEQRQAALVSLGDQLRDLRDLSSLSAAAADIVGAVLDVARVGYGQVDSSGEFVEIENDWTNGQVPSLAGRYRFSDFGPELSRTLQTGEAFIASDVARHPITASESGRWEALQIRAVINLPLFEKGRLVAVLFAQDSKVRHWTEADLIFLRKVADRTWAAAERSRALSELEESEAFTRSVLASTPDCLQVLDLEGRLLTMNDRCGGQMGIDSSTHINRPWTSLWGESLALAEDALAKARQGLTQTFESFCPTLHGSPKWWEIVVTPIRDASGQPFRILSLSRDITGRKSAEQERERLTQELKRSNEDLSQFAHTVAHDLQTPLRGVTSFAQLLQRNEGGRLQPRDLEFVGHIVVSARHMADLVGGLLRFAQVGQGAIRKGPVVMEHALKSALEALQLQIDEQCAVITYDALPTVTGDFVQMVQLLQNLIGNALKYKRPGIPPRVHISCSRHRSFIQFNVDDNGEGIAPQYLQVIFEPMKRLHGVEVSGTGLGLSVCQRIIDRHRGRIWVESEVESGSRFSFTIPTDEDDSSC